VQHEGAAELVVREPAGELASPAGEMTWTRDQVDLVKRTVAKGASDDELRLFMHVCQRTKLDPFAKQIYFIKRWDTDSQQMVFQPQTAIDGLRLIAERTGEYEGMARAVVVRRGRRVEGRLDGRRRIAVAAKVDRQARRAASPQAVALMREYVQTKRDGTPTRMWSAKGMPVHMIGKCAEALALRAQFPQELGDVYSFEELSSPNARAKTPRRQPWSRRSTRRRPPSPRSTTSAES
jgi:phage recombination protein Bet